METSALQQGRIYFSRRSAKEAALGVTEIHPNGPRWSSWGVTLATGPFAMFTDLTNPWSGESSIATQDYGSGCEPLHPMLKPSDFSPGKM